MESGTGQVDSSDARVARGDATRAYSPGAETIDIFDTIDVAIVVVGRDHKVARFNRAATAALGLAHSDIGRPPGDIQALSGVHDLEKACAQAIVDGAPCQREMHNGDRWFQVRIAPYAEDGRAGGAVLTFTNVTAFRALIGQAIYERESAKAILNTVIQPLVVLDSELRVQTANQAFHTMFGISRAEVQGVSICELGDSQWKTSALWSALRETLCGNGSFQTVEIERAFAVGRRTVLLDARRLAQQNGGGNLILLAFQDITERKAADDALRQAKQAADEANRAKDRFMAVLSHELRTPLTPVVMAVAAMELNPDLPPNVRDDLTMIRRNVELESKLIDDLLDLSRIISGKLRLVFDRLEINELIRRACDTCRPNILMKGIELECHLSEGAYEIIGDPGRLQQVFWNLLNNAAKFTPEGGQIHVTTENSGTSDADAWVRVTVRDTGIGITAEILPRIFDAFQQGEDGTMRQYGGMGLGLTIAKLLVEQHRGTIRAQSDGAGSGSTFVVELPALISRESAAAAPSLPAANAGGAALRVMIVEDHADTAAILGKLLRAQGHIVNTATTAADALALAGKHPFDLIISDLGLPDMTGYELMREMREKYGIRGIAMSGYGMEEDIRKSERAGFSDHLVKPLNLTQLEECIRRVTDLESKR